MDDIVDVEPEIRLRVHTPARGEALTPEWIGVYPLDDACSERAFLGAEALEQVHAASPRRRRRRSCAAR